MTLLLKEISKRFQGVHALSGVDLELKPGEVHALLGENGAGKSTLIKIITGVHEPDSGQILLDGEPLVVSGPREASHKGISVVHQERNLVKKFSVAENVLLHDLPRRNGVVDYRRLYDEARQWLERVGLDVDPRRETGDLSPGQGQLLEIAKALSLQARYLLLDEPTASIGEDETQRLFSLLRQLREDGTALLFVSHKLNEVEALCDRVTVIRDGHNVLTGVPLADTTYDSLVEAMVGRQFVRADLPPRPERPADDEPAALEIRGGSTEYGHSDVDLALRPGEIVGLYGLVGAGRTELARSIVGLGHVTGGEVLVRGEPARIRNPHDALHRYGIGYVSEDRKGEGLILSQSVQRNVGITVWGRLAGKLGWLTDARVRGAVEEPVKRLAVRMTSLSQPVANLSGGNQQKVSAAKWLAAHADVLIFDEPTVGIDVGAKDEVHRLIWDLAGSGKAILLISSDLREVVQLADRILVMAAFRLRADLPNTRSYDEMSQAVIRAIVGHDPEGVADEGRSGSTLTGG